MDHHKEMPNWLVFSVTNIPTSVIVLGKVCINFKRKPCFMFEMAQLAALFHYFDETFI